MRLVAARDGPHFSHARMHLSGLLDLAFSDSVRPYFYFAWGCFRNFGSRSAMYRARDTRLSMLGAAAKRFNFKPSCSSLLVSNQRRRTPCHLLWKLWDENTNQE